MFLIEELKNFLIKSGVKRVKLNNQVLKSSLKQFVVFDLIIVLVSALIIAITLIFFDAFKDLYASREKLPEISFIKSIFYFCFIASLVEELTFRIGLKVARFNMAIYLGFNLMVILQISGFIEQTLLIRLILISFTSLGFFLFLKDKHLSFFKNNFTIFLYFNIIYFSLIHLGNYSFSHFSQYVFAPILILPHFFLGIYLSYSRLKFGFCYSLFIHFSHNFCFIVLTHIL